MPSDLGWIWKFYIFAVQFVPTPLIRLEEYNKNRKDKIVTTEVIYAGKYYFQF